ncbi:MAG: alcohol dehydrogenase catalytic domain-containing protein [Elusimicrobia bacterium]|nr:alcohol dehydrogenase catalytic domain-containing protein [Elusimicrobiota bacterium]
MKALLYEGPQKVAVKDVPVPEPGEGEALVAVEACGLCGTDILKITQGKTPPPVALGHEVAGRVAALGEGVKGFAVGDRVLVAHHVPCGECHLCRRGSETMCPEFKRTNLDPGGFAEFVRVSARHVARTMLKIPKRLDFNTASQVEPLACCVRNAKRLSLQEGDVAVVVGLGSIGLMMAQVLKARGATVVGMDLEPSRVKLAQKLGLEHAYTGREGRTDEVVRSLSGRRGADALIFTGATPAVAAERLAWLRDGGTLNVFASFHPDPHLRLDLNAVYHRELVVLASYSATPDDLGEALGLIERGEIDLDPYIRHTFPLNRFPEALRQARGREILKAILLPQRG